MKNKRYVCYKLFTVGQHEKEEQWLNSMSAKGMRLTHVGLLRYEFEPCLPNEYQYRLEFLEELPTHPSSVAYLTFLEDYGVEHVASLLRWVYLEKKTVHGESFTLFSDSTSLHNHYQRIYRFALFFTIFEAILITQYFYLIMPVSGLVVLLILSFGIFLTTTFSLHRKMKRIKRDNEMFDR